MFSPSFAAARPSLRSVYHNLPAGARGKPPSAHGSAPIRPTPGNHCPRSPGTAPSAGPPVTRPTHVCRSARHIAFRPFFTRRTQHRCFGVEPPPLQTHIYASAPHNTFRSFFTRRTRSRLFVPCSPPSPAAQATGLSRVSRRLSCTLRGFRVCRGGVRRGGCCTCRGGVRRGGCCTCRDAPKKQSGARFFGLRAVVTGFTGASGKARRSPRRSCRAGYPGGRHRRTRSRRGTARLPL